MATAQSQYELDEMKLFWRWVAGIVGALIALLFAWGFFAFISPNYRVWQQEMEGRAELSRANQNRQIAVADAAAARERAEGEADAEVIRARGTNESNRIVTEGLTGPAADRYLEYLRVQVLSAHPGALVYIPTEAGMPILEANRPIPTAPENN